MNSAEMRKERLKSSSLYLLMKRISVVLDKYYLDGVIGFLPYGIGDVVRAHILQFGKIALFSFDACHYQ